MDTNKMITADTARKIWSCYKEMEHCQELMAAAHERLKQETEGRTSRDEPEKKYHPIEMGIPYFQRDRSDTSHRIYQLTTDLAVTVLEAHLKNQEEKLRKLMMMAQQELNGLVVVQTAYSCVKKCGETKPCHMKQICLNCGSDLVAVHS